MIITSILIGTIICILAIQIQHNRLQKSIEGTSLSIIIMPIVTLIIMLIMPIMSILLC